MLDRSERGRKFDMTLAGDEEDSPADCSLLRRLGRTRSSSHSPIASPNPASEGSAPATGGDHFQRKISNTHNLARHTTTALAVKTSLENAQEAGPDSANSSSHVTPQASRDIRSAAASGRWSVLQRDRKSVLLSLGSSEVSLGNRSSSSRSRPLIAAMSEAKAQNLPARNIRAAKMATMSSASWRDLRTGL